MDMIFVFGVRREATLSGDISPVRSTSMYFSVAPARWHAIRHGSILLWCSETDTRTSSPGWSSSSDRLKATRFMLSDVLRVKMISFSEEAWIKSRTVTRACS